METYHASEKRNTCNICFIHDRKGDYMNKAYVEWRDGGYWIANSRVSLDSVVYAFQAGETAESIAQSFPVLTLEQVYGAIAFYLANQTEIDTYLEKVRVDCEARRKASRERDPMFYQKLADAKRRAQVVRE